MRILLITQSHPARRVRLHRPSLFSSGISGKLSYVYGERWERQLVLQPVQGVHIKAQQTVQPSVACPEGLWKIVLKLGRVQT